MANCILCNKSAQRAEKTNPSNIFCNSQCQKLHYIGVKIRKKRKVDVTNVWKFVISQHLTIQEINILSQTSTYFAEIFANDRFRQFFATYRPQEVINYVESLFLGEEMVGLGWIKFAIRNQLVDPAFDSNLPIRWAIAHNNTNLVQFLLTYDRVNVPEESIRIAAENGNIEILQLMPRLTRNVFHTLVMFNHVEAVRVLIKTADEESMQIAAQNGYLEMLELLITKGGILTSNLMTLAAEAGHKDMVIRLLDDDRIIPDLASLYVAIRYNRNDLVRLFLHNPKARKYIIPTTATMHYAIEYNNLFAVKELMKDGSVVIDNYTVMLAVRGRRTDILKVFLFDADIRKMLGPELVKRYSEFIK